MVDDTAAQPSPAWTQREEDLRIALQHPDREKIRALIAAGANVNARDVIGSTALHGAVNFRGDIEVIRLLLDRGANVNAPDNNGYPPLLTALRHAHYKHSDPQRLHAVAELLLSRGASAKIAGADGALPMRAAMDPVNIPLLRLLLKHGAAVPDDGLDWALSNGQVGLLKLMMEQATPGMLAFKDPGGGGLLHRAAEKHTMVFAMEWLMRKGANLNAVDNDGITPFGRAAFHDNIPGMEWLQNNKASMRMVSSDGMTPLHLAAYGARHEVVRWLLDRGADVKLRDKYGRTPLDIAIDTHPFAYYEEARKLELVTMLGGTSVDIARGRFSKHPLYEAMRNYDRRAVEKLLKAGADPNMKNAEGYTPLSLAITLASGGPATPDEIAFGKWVLPLLISHGADPGMRKPDGETYEEWARGLRFGGALESIVKRYAPKQRR